MKQTVEEAARENILFNHRTADRTLSGKNLAQFGRLISFKVLNGNQINHLG